MAKIIFSSDYSRPDIVEELLPPIIPISFNKIQYNEFGEPNGSIVHIHFGMQAHVYCAFHSKDDTLYSTAWNAMVGAVEMIEKRLEDQESGN